MGTDQTDITNLLADCKGALFWQAFSHWICRSGREFYQEGKQNHLELISTDHRPVFEIEFAKPRGKDPKPPQQLVFEDFISVKGIKALGNQVTTDKVKQFNVLDALPYINPMEETPADIEVEGAETVDQAEEGNTQITSWNR